MLKKASTLYTLAIVLLSSKCTLGKVVTCTPDLSQNINYRWQFCTKMAFAKDRDANISTRVEFHEPFRSEYLATAGQSKPKRNALLLVFKEE